MIGTRFYKPLTEETEAAYAEAAEWCNNNNATIDDLGEYYEVVGTPAPTLEEAKADKLAELKACRDADEVADIEVNGHLYDYDDKARERINAALIALDLTGGSITWTLADNTDTEVTAADLKYVVAAVAQRSNTLHIKYRALKERVNAAQTTADVDSVVWEG